MNAKQLIALPAYVVSISKGTYRDGGSDPDYSLKHKNNKSYCDDYTEPERITLTEELGLYIPSENI